MTPERLQQIKAHAEYNKFLNPAATGHVVELLAALEEAQQQNEALRRSLTKEACTNAANARQLAEAQKNYKYTAEASDMVNTALRHVAEERNALRQEMAEAQQTITLEKDRRDYWGDKALDLQEQLGEAQQTIARQREALEFYAEHKNWPQSRGEIGYALAEMDGGDRARAALGNKEGETQP